MDKIGWMPVNPCPTCPSGPNRDPQAFDGCSIYGQCIERGMFLGGKKYQKVLLEHLLTRYQLEWQYENSYKGMIEELDSEDNK